MYLIDPRLNNCTTVRVNGPNLIYSYFFLRKFRKCTSNVYDVSSQNQQEGTRSFFWKVLLTRLCPIRQLAAQLALRCLEPYTLQLDKYFWVYLLVFSLICYNVQFFRQDPARCAEKRYPQERNTRSVFKVWSVETRGSRHSWIMPWAWVVDSCVKHYPTKIVRK